MIQHIFKDENLDEYLVTLDENGAFARLAIRPFGDRTWGIPYTPIRTEGIETK